MSPLVKSAFSLVIAAFLNLSPSAAAQAPSTDQSSIGVRIRAEIVEDGEPTGMVELPVEWIRDDAVYFNMDRGTTLRPYTAPSAVLEIFRAEFDGAHGDGGLFLLTMHPHIIGHRSRLALLETLIEHIKGHEDVWFATHAEIAEYCLAHGGEC